MSNLTRTIKRNKVRLQIKEYNDMADQKNAKKRAVPIEKIRKPSVIMSRIWRFELKPKRGIRNVG